MKNFTLLFSFLILSSFLFAQELSKKDKNSKKHLEKNISVNKLDVFNHAGVLQYTNTVLTLEFKGISSQYQSSIESIGAYCIGTLYPLKNVSQVSIDGVQSISYYPQFQAYFDKSDNQMHAMQKLIIPKDAKLITIYNFDSENGNGLMMEFFVKNTGAYSYGFVLESELRILMDRVSKKEIGLMSDERDGRTYKWVMIGDQKWFGENLQYIINEHKSMDLTVPYSNYFGRYYNYNQSISSCPKGWHIPSDGEWKQMELEIGVAQNLIDEMGMVSRGGDNVSPGTSLASSHDLMFYAKYSGAVSNKTGIYKLSASRENAQFWTSSKADEVNAFMRVLGKQFDGVVRDKTGTQNFISCRCVKDQDLSVIKNSSSVLKEISAKIDAVPSNASNYFDRSIEFFLAGESRFAIDDINKAIELNGKSLEQKLFKAQILFLYSFEKDADEIRKLVAEYTNEVKDNDYAFYFQSRLALYDARDGGLKVTSDSERRKKASELIDKALAIDSENPFYNNYKAKLLVVNGEYAAAIKALKKELKADSKNGETHYLLAKMKLKNYHTQNVKNNSKAGEWCTQITGMCFKLTPTQIKDACNNFKKAINYGAEVSPDYLTICAELKQAETLEKHRPIVYTGPRGGRYTRNSNGNKCYIPRR